MGLLDELAGAVLGSSGGKNPLMGSVLQMLTGAQGGAQGGGLAGLVKAFTDNGLGDIAGSWVGTGANLPVSAQQIQQALGGGQLERLAQQHGIQPEAAASQLAQMLPGIVDKLTPGGKIPDAQSLQGLLKGLLG